MHCFLPGDVKCNSSPEAGMLEMPLGFRWWAAGERGEVFPGQSRRSSARIKHEPARKHGSPPEGGNLVVPCGSYKNGSEHLCFLPTTENMWGWLNISGVRRDLTFGVYMSHDSPPRRLLRLLISAVWLMATQLGQNWKGQSI